jgi:hypothetical protein
VSLRTTMTASSLVNSAHFSAYTPPILAVHTYRQRVGTCQIHANQQTHRGMARLFQSPEKGLLSHPGVPAAYPSLSACVSP